MTELFDVIDEQIACDMLEQHDRYAFGRFSVSRRKGEGWRVYVGGYEMRAVMAGENWDDRTIKPFHSLASAVEYLMNNREAYLEHEAAIKSPHDD